MPRLVRHEFSLLEKTALRGNVHSQDERDRSRLKEQLPNKLDFVKNYTRANVLLSEKGLPEDSFVFENVGGLFDDHDHAKKRKKRGFSDPKGGADGRYTLVKPRTIGRSKPGSPGKQAETGATRKWRKLSDHFIKSLAEPDTKPPIDEEEAEAARRATSKRKLFSFRVEDDGKAEEKEETLYLHTVWQKVRSLQAIGIKLGRKESSGQFLVRILQELAVDPLQRVSKKAGFKLLQELRDYLLDAVENSSAVRSSKLSQFSPLFSKDDPLVQLMLRYVLYFFDHRVGAGLPDNCAAAILPEGERLDQVQELTDAYSSVLKSISAPPPLPLRQLPRMVGDFFLSFFLELSKRQDMPSSEEDPLAEEETTAGPSPTSVAATSPATPMMPMMSSTNNLSASGDNLNNADPHSLSQEQLSTASLKKFRIPKNLAKSTQGPAFRLSADQSSILRAKGTARKVILDLAESEAYKALEVMLPAEETEVGLEKNFFKQKTQDEIREAISTARPADLHAERKEAVEEDPEHKAAESSAAEQKQHAREDAKYHEAAEKCMDQVRDAMKGTITDRKIVKVMNLKRFDLQDFKKLLQQSGGNPSEEIQVRKALERLLVLSNHGVSTGAYWTNQLTKQTFTILLEKGRVCDAATGRQAFELIRQHVAAKRRCICSDFLQKTTSSQKMPCSVQERERELERERKRIAEMQASQITDEQKLREIRLKKEREEKMRKLGETIAVRTHMISAEQLEMFLKNPDPMQLKGISFGKKEKDEEDEDEIGGAQDAAAAAKSPATEAEGELKKDSKQQSAEQNKELLQLLRPPEVLLLEKIQREQAELEAEQGIEKSVATTRPSIPRRSSTQALGSKEEDLEPSASGNKPAKFRENAPVMTVSLEDVLVCLGGSSPILAGDSASSSSSNGGSSEQQQNNQPGEVNNYHNNTSSGAHSPASPSHEKLQTTGATTMMTNKQTSVTPPTVEILTQLRQRILENFESTVDAFQNMAFLVVGPDKKSWNHLTVTELHRVFTRILGEIPLSFVQDLVSCIDNPLSCGRVSLREVLIALSVVSPSLNLEFLRAKCLGLHGSLQSGLEELLEPGATVSLIRKRVAEAQKFKSSASVSHNTRRSSKRSQSKLLSGVDEYGTSGVSMNNHMGAPRRSATGSKSGILTDRQNTFGGGPQGGSGTSLQSQLSSVCVLPKSPHEALWQSLHLQGQDEEIYDENTTSGALEFHRLVNTYAPVDFSDDIVFKKYANEVILPPSTAATTIRGGIESRGHDSAVPMTPSDTGRFTPLFLSPEPTDQDTNTCDQSEGWATSDHPRQGKKFSSVFKMPVHSTDTAKVLGSKLEREQEELCLRENFRYLHESFVGRSLVEAEEVLRQFCLPLGFFVDRCQQLSWLNKI
ncbi:unnamed protein product, partial [Amoebophrya sp. A120]|eukprot:GSA120T00008384001.1